MKIYSNVFCFSLTFILQSDLFIILIEVQKCKEICVKVVKFIMVDPVGFKMSTQVNWWEILTFLFLVLTVLFSVTRLSYSSVCVHKETMSF